MENEDSTSKLMKPPEVAEPEETDSSEDEIEISDNERKVARRKC